METGMGKSFSPALKEYSSLFGDDVLDDDQLKLFYSHAKTAVEKEVESKQSSNLTNEEKKKIFIEAIKKSRENNS